MSDYQGNIIIKNPATPTGPVSTGRAPGMWKLNEVAYWIKQGVWPNPNIPAPDTFFPYVSLLLSTTSLGNANNNLFVDSSGAFNPISRNGNATQGSFTPYSTNWSNYFDGNGDYLTAANSAAIQLGTGNFTVEGWFNLASFTTAPIFDQRASGPSTNAFIIAVTSAGKMIYYSYSPLRDVTFNTTLSINTWYHFAFVRSGNTGTMYINGVAEATTVDMSGYNNTSSANRIMQAFDPAYATGYLSNFRIVKGTAVYTANFTPPTAPLTAISGTGLLTCQSNRFIDNSGNNLAITVYGDSRVTDFGPFNPTYPGAVYNQSDITNWSGYFDGSGDYLTAPSNSAFEIGTGQFTLECWIYFNTVTNINEFLWADNSGTTGGRLVMYYSGGSLQIVAAGGAGGTSASWTPVAGQWYHLAASRDASNNQRLFVDGVLLATATSTNNYTQNGFAIARAASLNGYMSNVRLVKGTAVYTSTFTPPTAPLTAISGTSLLTLQNAAFTDNSANNFVITPFGNTTVTGNSPFNTVGYWSNYFDGSGDYLTQASVTLGSGSFTVEMWVFLTSLPNAQNALFSCGTSDGSTNCIWYINSSGNLILYSSGDIATTSTTVPLNQWVHLAIVRDGTSVTNYINGVARGTGTTSRNFSSTPFQIFRGYGGISASPIGYASNLRVVVGTAVYTANFTVPTAPLTAITNTSLLTCQNGGFIDNSTNNFTITRFGDTSVQSFDPFYTATVASNSGSLYLDGAGDYLTSPTSQAYNFGSSNFTIEGWFYFTNSTANQLQCMYSNYTSFSPAGSIYFGKHSSSNSGCVSVWFSSYSTGGPLLAETTYPPNNAWTHYALVRNGNTFTLYRNGVSTASASWSGAATAGSCPAFIGVPGDAIVGYNYFFPGYMSDFRITKSAVYTAAFTPPTAPLTPSASTTLLLNGMNAGVYDATAINDMETVGNAQVRFPSPFAPANYWGGYFNGSNWLNVADNTALDFGTGDFTVECWVNFPVAPSGDQVFVAGWTAGEPVSGWTLTMGTTGFSFVSAVSASYVVATNTADRTAGVWHHVAAVRSSGSVTVYVNGVGNTPTSNTQSINTQSSGLDIARSTYTANRAYYTGSISNLRIVKGTAVYTSNFTPPTSPLTAISGTSLLTCQNKTFIDNSTNAFTITANGNATAGAIGPFTATGGTSVYFDGSGDALAARTNPAFAFGTGSFTIEAWVNVISYAGTCAILDTRIAGNEATGVIFYITASGQLSIYNNGTLATSSGSISPNTWAHVAVTRNGTTVTFWINGVSSGTATVSTNFTQQNGYVGTAYNASSNPFYGYIDDLRVTNGVARYTSNFTPPTQAFPTY